MKRRQASGAHGGWGQVLLGSTVGLLGALVGRKLARRQVPPPVEAPRALATESLPPEKLLLEAAPESPLPPPVVRRGPNGRERYEFIGWEAAASTL
jgi:hypothetical protein